VGESGIEAEVIKTGDMETIARYGVLSAPALVVDGVVKSAGKLPEIEQIKEWLK